MVEKQFDLAIHLVGKQPYPNLMGMRDLNAKRHLLLTSNETFDVAEKLKDTVGCEGSDIQIVKLSDPNDTDKIIAEFTRQEDFVGKRIAVNTTSGTKPMAFATMLGFEGRECNVNYFYYDTQFERRFHWPIKNSERRTESTPFSDLNVRIQLNDFIGLFDYSVNPPKEDYDSQVMSRKNLTQKIWEYRWIITSVKSEDAPYNTLQTEADVLSSKRGAEIWNETTITPISFHKKRSKYNSKSNRWETVEIHYDTGTNGQIIFNGNPVTIPAEFVDFPDYLAGKWFEEYVYLALKNVKSSGRLLEIRPNVSVRSKSSPKFGMQEFDLLATDGVRLFVVECKAGNVTQDHVVKLDKLASDYAGVFGVGVLVAQKYQNNYNEYIRPILEKIDNSKNVYCFHGPKCVELLEQYMPDLGTPKGQKGPIFS